MNKPIVIIILLVLFFPVGLYFMWKNDVWSLQTRTTITLILFFPVGIYLMFKKKVWSKKTRVIVSSIIGVIWLVGNFIPPSFSPKDEFIIEMRDYTNCSIQCEGMFYMEVIDEKRGFIGTRDGLGYSENCGMEFTYEKTSNSIKIKIYYSGNLNSNCTEQFEGTYTKRNSTFLGSPRWNNGKVKLESYN